METLYLLSKKIQTEQNIDIDIHIFTNIQIINCTTDRYQISGILCFFTNF